MSKDIADDFFRNLEKITCTGLYKGPSPSINKNTYKFEMGDVLENLSTDIEYYVQRYIELEKENEKVEKLNIIKNDIATLIIDDYKRLINK